MILIFTLKDDFSSSQVCEILTRYGEKVVRINGDDDFYKFDSITQNGIYFINTLTNEQINIKDASACWWRRNGISKRNFISNIIDERKKITKQNIDLSILIDFDNKFIKNEYLTLKEYIYASIFETCTINLGKPIFDLNRLIVFDLAKKYELKIPDYNIITNGDQLCKTKENFGSLVTKAISNGINYQNENKRFYTYTELLEEKFYIQNSTNIFFPSIVSSLIEKKIEIRSFYLNGDFFSMAIFSQSDKKTKIDFRKYSNNRNEPYKLPKEIENKLKKIFIELELNTGSVDLILDKENNYIFLEINPVGQYGMTSIPCNYELDIKIANFLTNGRILKKNKIQ